MQSPFPILTAIFVSLRLSALASDVFGPRVLPPWTPVQVSGREAKVWNRTYRFGQGPAPLSVSSGGEELLAAPIRVVLTSKGEAASWTQATCVSADPVAAVFHSVGQAAGVRAQAETRIEYDGFVWVRIRVEGRVERLELRVPLRATCAKLFTHDVIGTQAVSSTRWQLRHTPERQWWAGAVPRERWTAEFTPQVWIGTEGRGLAWFTESARVLRLAAPNRATEIETKDGRVTLTVRAVDHPVLLPESYEWQFGFMATPARLLPERYRRVRIASSAAGTPESFRQRFMTPGVWASEAAISTVRGPATFALWARLDRTDGKRTLFGSRSQELTYDGDAQSLEAQLMDQGGKLHKLSASAQLVPKQWHHLAVTHDGHITSLYLDGHMLAEREDAFDFASVGDVPFCIGANGWGSRRAFAALDDVCILSRACSREQIVLMTEGAYVPEKDSALVAHWSFESSRGASQFEAASPSQIGANVIEGKDELGTAKLVRGPRGRAVELSGQFLRVSSNLERVTGFEYLRRTHITHLVLWNNWSDIWGYPGVSDPTYAKFLRELLDAAHRHDIKVLPYISVGIMMQDEPGCERVRARVTTDPKPRFRRRDKRGYFVHKNQVWAEYYSERLAEFARDFDIDGVYMDGAGLSAPLDVALKGGSKAEKLPVAYDLLGGRELARRMYTVFHGGVRDDGFVFTHCSTPALCAQVGFNDAFLTGELHYWLLAFRHLTRAQHGLAERFPPALCRAWFAGDAYGMPMWFCGKHRTKPYTDGTGKWLRGELATEDEILAVNALHGTGVWTNSPMKNPGLPVSRLWAIEHEFGVDGAEWLPYWRNAYLITVAPSDVRVSAYRRKDGALLLLGVSFADRPVTAEIRLDQRGLGLRDSVRGENVTTGGSVAIRSGVLRVPLPPGELAVIRVHR